MKMRSLISFRYVVCLALATIFFFASSAYAAPGDYVATVNFSQQCESGLGVGIAYDGTNLWYSCYERGYENSKIDLHRADPNTGLVTASYDIIHDGGLGALSYDAMRNVIWAGEGGGGPGGEPVYRIDLDAAKNVVGSALVFHAAVPNPWCDLDDGLAFDARSIADPTDDVIYYSNDCGSPQIIYVFDLTGGLVESFLWAGTTHYNSGLAIGGQLLYQGSNGASHVWVVDKVTKLLQFDFPTNVVPTDPNFRDEDLECDTDTFAAIGKHVVWSKEAYLPMRAHAFEIELGSCGVGGEPPEPIIECIETVNPAGKNVPPAGKTTLPGPKGGQNEDGFYELLGYKQSEIYVVDRDTGVVFGPFASGDKIKYTEANGVTPRSKTIGGPNSAIAAHIMGNGDLLAYAVNVAGVKSKPVRCLVPPLPK